MDKIKNGIQKDILRWFGHMMQMREERIPKKMLHKTLENDQEEDQIRKDIKMGGENWEEIQEKRKWENQDGWRFPVIVD